MAFASRAVSLRDLRIATGWVLFAYITTHLANHSLGLLGLGAMEAGRRIFLAFWRSPVCALALYGSLTVHFGLALWALYQRRHLRMPVADLASAGFPLIGGRVDYVNSRPVAALVYRHRQHWIDLFVWPDAKSSRVSPEALSKQGYNVLRWSDAGMTFWAISDVNAAELKTFAEAYASAR